MSPRGSVIDRIHCIFIWFVSIFSVKQHIEVTTADDIDTWQQYTPKK